MAIQEDRSEAEHRRAALQELPTAYAVALRLHDAGVPDDQVAEALDLPADAIPQLLQIGETKLRALLGG